MGHAGKCRALKSLEAVAKKFAYLEDGSHPNHRHYKQPDKLRARGLADARQFPNRCQQLFDTWHRQNRLHTGRKPKVLAWWWMPRFADRVVLSPEEKCLVEKRLLTALPKGVLVVFNWHLPLPVELGKRPKGPDFNFMFSNLTRGALPQLSRDSETSHWGILTKAMDNVVDEINANRRLDYKQGRTKDLSLIYTMAAAKARRKKHRPLPLCEQLACLPNAGDSLAELNLALAELGYVFTPARVAGSGYVRRRHCPALQTGRRKHRFKGAGYFITLEKLLAEVQQAIQRRSQDKVMTAVAPAARQPLPPPMAQAPLASRPSAPPSRQATARVSPPAPSLAPQNTAPAPAFGASPSPTPAPPSPEPPTRPTAAPKAKTASPAPTVTATKTPEAAISRTMKPARQAGAAPEREKAVTPPKALDRTNPASKPVTVAPVGQAMAPVPPKPPASSMTPKKTAPVPAASTIQTLPRQPVKAPAQSPAATAKPQTARPPAPVTSVPPPIPPEAPAKPPLQPPAPAPEKVRPATSSSASPTPIASSQAKRSQWVTPPPNVCAPEAIAAPELNPEQQIDLTGALVRRILSAITDRDPMPRSIEDCVILGQRAGVGLRVSPEDADKVTLHSKGQQCEAITSVIQLAICMEIIHARLPKKARRLDRGQWEYDADTWLKAEHVWLSLINNTWDKTEAALKDAKVSGAWITAFDETTAGKTADWTCHLHQALTSADLESDMALLIVASQVPATVPDLEAVRTRINERIFSP